MVPIKSLPHRFGSWPLKAKLMLGFGLIIVMVVMLSGFALNGFNRVIEAFHQNDQVAGLNRQALESRIEQHRFNAEADLQALDRAVGLLKKMADTPIISSNEHSIAPLLTDYINSLDHQGDAAIRQRQARNNMESASSTVDRSLTHNHLQWLRFVESGKSETRFLIENLEKLRDQADKLEAGMMLGQALQPLQAVVTDLNRFDDSLRAIAKSTVQQQAVRQQTRTFDQSLRQHLMSWEADTRHMVEVADQRFLSGVSLFGLAILEADGISTSKLRYSASNGGGDAIRKFSTGYALAMVTGLGEVIDQIKDGSLRVLGVTSEQRIEGLDAPTLKEQGIDVVLANWRGFFTSKDMRPGLLKRYKDMLATMNTSPEWKATRKKYGWEPFYLTSDQASTFLVSQEEIISNLIRKVDQL